MQENIIVVFVIQKRNQLSIEFIYRTPANEVHNYSHKALW